MIALMFLFGVVILICWSAGAGLVVGLCVGSLRRAMSRKQVSRSQRHWPFMLSGVMGSWVGCLYGVIHGVQKHLSICQGTGTNCQYEAAGIGFTVGLVSAVLGSVIGVVVWIVIVTLWRKSVQKHSP